MGCEVGGFRSRGHGPVDDGWIFLLTDGFALHSLGSPVEGGAGRVSCAFSPRPCPCLGWPLCGHPLLLRPSCPCCQREEGPGGRPGPVSGWWTPLPFAQHGFQQRRPASGEQGLSGPGFTGRTNGRGGLLCEDQQGQPGRLTPV